MAITNAIITSTTSTIYTSLVPTSAIGNAITTMIFCNTAPFNAADPTANQALLTVYAVPAIAGNPPTTGTAADGNMIINKLPIPAGETVSLDQEKMVLSDGDTIQAKAESANLTATISTLVA